MSSSRYWQWSRLCRIEGEDELLEVDAAAVVIIEHSEHYIHKEGGLTTQCLLTLNKLKNSFYLPNILEVNVLHI